MNRTFLRIAFASLLATLAQYGCGAKDRSFVDVSEGAGATGGTGGSSNNDAGQSFGGEDSGGSSSGGTTSGGSSSGGTTNGGSSSGSAGAPNAGAGGEGGEGGTGVVPPEVGRPGQSVVAAGSLMHSTNYTLVLTVGESPGGNVVAQSSKFKMISGVIGTTQP